MTPFCVPNSGCSELDGAPLFAQSYSPTVLLKTDVKLRSRCPSLRHEWVTLQLRVCVCVRLLTQLPTAMESYVSLLLGRFALPSEHVRHATVLLDREISL